MRILSCIVVLFATGLVWGQNDFVTTWKTDNAGTSGSTEITIPTTGSGYNYDVDWDNDGTFDEFGLTGNVTHDFGTAGTYTIRIAGDFPRIYFNNGGDKDKIVDVSNWGDIQWSNFNSAFRGCSNLDVSAADAPDLSNVTNLFDSFRDCSSFTTSIDHWNVSTITNFGGMFEDTPYNQPLNSWVTSSGTSFNYMFWNAAFNQPLDNWDMSSAQSFTQMFYLADFNQDISGWTLTSAQTMNYMFRDSDFDQDLSGWNVSNVNNMREMFRGTDCNYDLSGWDVSNVTNMRGMFRSSQYNHNLGDWNMSSVTNAQEMFNSSAMSVENYDSTLIGWNAQMLQSGVTLGATGIEFCAADEERAAMENNYAWTFDDAGQNCGTTDFAMMIHTANPGTSGTTEFEIRTTGSGYDYDVDWDGDGTYDAFGLTGNTTHDYGTSGTYTIRIKGDFPRIFYNACGDKDKILSIEQWGENQWTSFANSFNDCDSLVVNATDAPDLSGVTSLNSMFANCESLSNEDFSNWNTSSITNMTYMFRLSNFNGNVSTWNVTSVQNFSHMFRDAAFNGDISGWTTTSAQNFEGMFRGNEYFNQDVSGWDASGVGNFGSMFNGCNVFNADVSGWDVSSATDMGTMFANCWEFDQDLSDWDVTGVTEFYAFLTNTGMSIANYDSLLIGWAQLPSLVMGEEFDAEGLRYCEGAAARDDIINNFGWTFDDEGTKCFYDDLVITVKTDNNGTSNATSFELPVYGTSTPVDIDWDNDGTYDDFGVTSILTHDYGTAGTYTISISGEFSGLYFNNGGDKDKILSVDQWGDSEWSNAENAFYGCSNLQIVASDTLEIYEIASVAGMFRDCDLFNDDLEGWNFNNVTDMSFMFADCPNFNQNVNGWDVADVTNMESMFQNCTSFNQDITGWNTEDVVLLTNMFNGATLFDGDITKFDVDNVTDATGMLTGTSFQTHYDLLLNRWINHDVQSNVTFDVGFATYCHGEHAHDTLTMDFGWTINDGGLNCVNEAMIMTYQTDNAGVTNSSSITIPIYFNSFSCYDVDWDNDGVWDTLAVQGSYVHDFGTPGTYTVRVKGNIPFIWFGNTGDKDKIISVDQWGTLPWASSYEAFYGCTNLQVPATDQPNFDALGGFSRFFKGCTNLNSSFNHWDVSEISGFFELFMNCDSLNQPFDNWDMSNATRLEDMFNGAESFNQSLASWDVSNVDDWDDFLTNAGISVINYDSTLISWSQLDLVDGVVADMGTSMYCAGEDARDSIIANFGWTFNDGGLDCSTLDHFVFTVNTSNSGTSSTTEMSIPTNGGYTYNYDIDWDNDGEFDDFGVTGDITHDYGVAGTYTIRIRGDFPSIYFNDGGDRQKMMDIQQWGTIQWGTMSRAFWGCTNILVSATDEPDLSQVISMDRMFRNCNQLVTGNLGDWDVSTIESFHRTFQDSERFNEDLSAWVTSSATNMSRMFERTKDYNQDMSNWDVSNVNGFQYMFYQCDSINQDLSNWVTSSANNMSNMFNYAVNFNGDVTTWNTSLVTNFANMFSNATSFDQDLSAWDISAATSASNMFNNVTLSTNNYDNMLISWG